MREREYRSIGKVTKTLLDISIEFGEPKWVKNIARFVNLPEHLTREFMSKAHLSAALRRKDLFGDSSSEKYRFHLMQADLYAEPLKHQFDSKK